MTQESGTRESAGAGPTAPCDRRPATRPALAAVYGADRPRERFLSGGEEVLSDQELLAVLIGNGVRGQSATALAGRLLRECGSLRRIGRLSVAELLRYRGIGTVAAVRILASFALTRRFASEVLEPGAPFRSSADLFRYFHSKLRDRKYEEFIAVLLDGKNRYLREVRISQGSLTASIVHPREVFLPAIRESAGAVILVHNHPSGDPSPSREDLDVTERLVQAGELLGIRVLDHIIVGECAYTSLLHSSTGEERA